MASSVAMGYKLCGPDNKDFEARCNGIDDHPAALPRASGGASAGAFDRRRPSAQSSQVYTATGIDVDITGDIATLRDQAMLEGQRKALQKVLSDIAPAERAASLTLPSDDVISTWVQDFEIEQEKTSATRYIGRFTFRFMAEPVQQYLAGNSVQFAQIQTKRLLVLPIYTDEAGNSNLWGPTNLWLATWSLKAPNVSLVPMLLPTGDVSDTEALSATQALAGDLPRLTALAQRYGAGDVLVTEVRASPPGADGRQNFRDHRHALQPRIAAELHRQRVGRSGDDRRVCWRRAPTAPSPGSRASGSRPTWSTPASNPP